MQQLAEAIALQQPAADEMLLAIEDAKRHGVEDERLALASQASQAIQDELDEVKAEASKPLKKASVRRGRIARKRRLQVEEWEF